MSTRGIVLRQPINGTAEQTWEGFSWPAFCFGVIWLLVKGLYGHFLISLFALIITAGFAAPIVWIVYGFIGNDVYKNALLKKGYITTEQWENQRTPTPVPSNPSRKDHLAQLRELAELRDKGILTEDEFNKQKEKLLGT